MRKDLLRQQQTCLFNEKIVSRLKRFISPKVDNSADIDEILQETMISAIDCLPMFSGKSSFFTWLCGIAKHEVVDFYRKKKVKTLLFSRLPWLENLATEALGPEQMLLRGEAIKRVQESLRSLSEGYQEILRLKYYQGLSVKEIARYLNETVKAVESRLFRAKKAFAKTFVANGSQRELSPFG